MFSFKKLKRKERKNMKSKISSKILSSLISCTMIFSMLTASGFVSNVNAENDISSQSAKVTDNGMILDKTTTLEDNGTYTINLEAYSTGETVTTISTNPTDVVLVLDVSGSMDENYTYVSKYDYVEDTTTKIRDCPSEILYHKCLDGTYSKITWTEIGDTTFGTGTFRYVCDHCKATRKWSTPLWKTLGNSTNDPWNLYKYTEVKEEKPKIEVLQEAANSFINDIVEKNKNISNSDEQHRISIVKFASESEKDSIGNDTYKSGSYTYNYTQVVKDLTVANEQNESELTGAINSLVPGGATASDKGLNQAQKVLSGSTDRDKVVVLFTDGDPTYGSDFQNSVASAAVTKAKSLKDDNTVIYTVGIFNNANPADTTSQQNKYMNAVSNNYPNATVTDSSNFTVELGDGGNNGYYKVANDSNELNNIFTEISHSVGTTKVTLDSNAVVKDVLGDGFILPEGYDQNQISVSTVKYLYRDRDGQRVFENSSTILTSAKVSIEGNTINVSGFDFSTNYLLDGNTTTDDKTQALKGEKLIITIPGIEVTDNAGKNTSIDTNGMMSGIYENSNSTTTSLLFDQPKTYVAEQSFVLDYANETNISLDQFTSKSLDSDGMKGFNNPSTQLTENYGKVNLNETTLSYKPTTTNWNGYDSFFVFGSTTDESIKSNSANSNGNVWSKVNVIPANNVYYDDSFVTNKDTGTVGIVYSGEWNTTNNVDMNTTTPVGSVGSNSVHGWEETYGNDAEDSNDSAHYSSNSTAKASFSFSGTGVDIYSRTDMTTGTVLVQLKSEDKDDNGNPFINKVLVVDNKGLNGTYYQIPTVSFNNLDYDKYNVTLYVTNQAASESRSTYYLDGIRVYNPLSNETDNTVQDAYGQEKGAMFTPVRDILLGAEDFGESESAQGAVFIDENLEGADEKTSTISTYEKFGPKSEVYLDKGQLIAFKVFDLNSKYYVGLKAPKGATKAEITNDNEKSTLNINAASDMYYELTPNDKGFVVIKNTGDNLLSITKLKVTNQDSATDTSYLSSVSEEEILNYSNEFRTLSLRDYKPVEDNTEDGSGDVEITNPDDNQDSSDSQIKEWFKNLFDKIREWFGK